MPVVTSGLYEVVLFQDKSGNELLNVFWYWEQGGDDGIADVLAERFDVTVLPLIAAIQETGIDYTLIRVQPVFGTGIEENLTPTTASGLVAGAAMSNAYAVSLRLFRSTNETRSGWKRFSGLVEENTNFNSFTAAYITDLDSLAFVLGQDLVDGADRFKPVIVRKPFSTVENDPDWVRNEISSVAVVDRPTTQNSRKLF